MYQSKRTPLRAVLTLLLALSALFGVLDYCIEDSISLRSHDPYPTSAVYTVTPAKDVIETATGVNSDYVAKLFGVIPVKTVTVHRYGDVNLCPGGMPFGVKMFTDGLIIVGFSDVDCESENKQPAYSAGLRMHDVILKINDTDLTSAVQMAEIVGNCGGATLQFTVRRGEGEMTVSFAPSFSISEQTYKTGVWVRDNTAGIGTVTFVDPATGAFAGLGHGICDSDTGALLPLSRGMIANVSISGVRRGTVGTPGELQGYFSSGKIGSLLGNTTSGVFGLLTETPAGVSAETAIPIALKDEIKDGVAYLYCTLDQSGIEKYEIRIRKIKNATDNKCMEITVTDPRLIEKTGGIVQGMSGSPLIQSGKIIGAVTHVLISDPTRGYGIYIENMLGQLEELTG